MIYVCTLEVYILLSIFSDVIFPQEPHTFCLPHVAHLFEVVGPVRDVQLQEADQPLHVVSYEDQVALLVVRTRLGKQQQLSLASPERPG